MSDLENHIYQPGGVLTFTDDVTFRALWTSGTRYVFDFETGKPEGWTASSEWSDNASGDHSGGSAHSGQNNMLYFSMDRSNSSDLVTTSFNLSNSEIVYLEFWYSNQKWLSDTDQLVVKYRAGSGEWVQLFEASDNHDTWTKQVIILPDEALTENVQFCFTGNSDYGYGIALDDVVLSKADKVTEPGTFLVGNSISLDGDIGINFYMELSGDIAKSDTAHMHFTIPSEDDETTADVFVKDAKSVESGGKTYYIFKCQVSSKEMTSRIRTQIIDGKITGTEYTYSVKEYADYLIAHAGEKAEWTAAVPIVKAMLNYGGYSQLYFNSNTKNLANADLTAQEKALGDPEITIADPTVANLPDGVSFVGSTLSLKSETTLSLYFKGSESLTFSCEDYTIESSAADGYQVARIRGIKANDIGKILTVKVNGNKVITYSALNYCKIMLNSNNADDSLKDVIKALYYFWDAANKYFS